ncbi:MAG: hypothetical protein A2Y33_07170 [Spirochaetes bacterium GWF1_51_8]|nr:MAG: hypothetical protein A2Y33_07170 [Spirochaetes bacterium GWF1_51_8]
MKKPLISIAMATYNGEKYLREQLDSLLAQDYSPVEIIVSDDASKDGTAGILKEYAKKCNLHYTVNPVNLGFVKNFVNAIQKCTGDFITFCDQDDIWQVNKLTRLLESIGGASLVCSDAELIDGSGKTISMSMFDYTDRHVPSHEELKTYLVWGNFVTGCTAMIRREMLKSSLPIPDGEKAHDWWFALRAAYGNGIAFVREPLVRYRQHATNTLGAGSEVKKGVFGKIARWFGGLFRDRRNSFDYRYAVTQSTRLPSVMEHLPLSDEDKQVYLDANRYYNQYARHYFHFGTAGIAWKYRKYNGIRNRLVWLKRLIG